MPREPRFRDLSREEIDELLGRQHVARVAFSFHDRVDIEPMHYVHDDGWIYFRTAPGHKLETIAHHRWVAVEVDEVRGMFDWQSVVVHGAVYVLDPGGAAHERAAWERGVRLLRELLPHTFTDDDPVPFRTTVLRIPTEDAVGKLASTRAED
jgi:uncharacterized protein